MNKTIIVPSDTDWNEFKEIVKESYFKNGDYILRRDNDVLFEFYNCFTHNGKNRERVKLFHDFFDVFKGTDFGISFSLWDGYIVEPGFASGGDSEGPYYDEVYGRITNAFDGYLVLDKTGLA